MRDPAILTRSDLPVRLFGVSVAGVAVLQIALIATHAYFVDEWQALQIAVQSPDLAALLANLRYEGHPPLWYLLLRGLAAIVGPGSALAVASLLCALTTLVLIATCAPLPRWARLTMMLAEPILFEFGTLSRGYSLGVAATFAALALWHRPRAFWIAAAVLPLVDFLFGVISLGLIVLRWSEGVRGWRPGIALFVLCSLAAAWSVIPAADFVSVYQPNTPLQSLARWIRAFAVVAVPVQWGGGPRWDVPWGLQISPVLVLAYLAIVLHQTRGRAAERLVAIGFPVFLLLFMLAVQILAVRHMLLSAVVFMAVLWRQGEGGLPFRRPTAAWLTAGAVCGLATAGFALARPFDTAPQAVRSIRAMGLESETWLSFPAQHAQGVSALSGIGFEGVELGCRPDYVRWNFRHRLTDPKLLHDWLTREAARGGSFYLLTQYPPLAGGPVAHVRTISAGLDSKVYHIYRVTGAMPGRRVAAPPCIPGNRTLPPLGRD